MIWTYAPPWEHGANEGGYNSENADKGVEMDTYVESAE